MLSLWHIVVLLPIQWLISKRILYNKILSFRIVSRGFNVACCLSLYMHLAYIVPMLVFRFPVLHVLGGIKEACPWREQIIYLQV